MVHYRALSKVLTMTMIECISVFHDNEGGCGSHLSPGPSCTAQSEAEGPGGNSDGGGGFWCASLTQQRQPINSTVRPHPGPRPPLAG